MTSLTLGTLSTLTLHLLNIFIDALIHFVGYFYSVFISILTSLNVQKLLASLEDITCQKIQSELSEPKFASSIYTKKLSSRYFFADEILMQMICRLFCPKVLSCDYCFTVVWASSRLCHLCPSTDLLRDMNVMSLPTKICITLLC